jgi:hypothetical protein
LSTNRLRFYTFEKLLLYTNGSSDFKTVDNCGRIKAKATILPQC